MKLLYVSTHQIHNLTPLFREMTKQNKIDFKVVYWQKIPSVHYDLEFNTKIDFSIDQFSNYEYTCLSDKQKKTFDLSLLFQLKILPKLIKLICNDKYDKIVFHSYRFSHVIASIFSKMRGKKNVIRSVSYNLGKRSLFKRILRQIYYRFANLFIDEYLPQKLRD